MYKISEPKAEDEENAIALKITTDMTPENVVQKILEITKWKVEKYDIFANKNQISINYLLLYFLKKTE